MQTTARKMEIGGSSVLNLVSKLYGMCDAFWVRIWLSLLCGVRNMLSGWG